MNKKVVINLANSTGWYLRCQQRLIKTIKEYYNVDILTWQSELDIGSPFHKDNPYAFKVYAFDKAIELGYTQIFWADASVYAIKSIEPIFDIIEKEGYFMQDAGHMVGTWSNNKSLEYFAVSRDDAMKMRMYGNCGLLGLNFDFQVAKDFFGKWKKSMLYGAFKGAWINKDNSESLDERCKGHRHDMTCGSIIANQLGMNKNYKNVGEWMQYSHHNKIILNNKILLFAEPA